MKDVTGKVREEHADLVETVEAAIAGKPYLPAQEASLSNPPLKEPRPKKSPFLKAK